jgi:hypothetical protein
MDDSTHKAAWIDVDWAHFHPWQILPVRHRLMSHPMLRPARLVELGQRLEARGQIRTHSREATPGTPFNDAPSLHPNARSAASTLADIANAGAWLSLLNVQTDDIYRGLVDEILDELKPQIDRVDPGMCYRGGWIFVTSPNTVTPFHMDREHNFIMQVAGRKRLYVWPPDDTVAVSELARDQFHDTHSRELVVWKEELRARAQVFDLEPGMGAYMPSTAPHMVENGPNPSITVSFTYYTASTRRDSLLHRAHNRLRQRGIALPAVGTQPAVDAALVAVAGLTGAFRASKDGRRDDARYAQHIFA